MMLVGGPIATFELPRTSIALDLNTFLALITQAKIAKSLLYGCMCNVSFQDSTCSESILQPSKQGWECREGSSWNDLWIAGEWLECKVVLVWSLDVLDGPDQLRMLCYAFFFYLQSLLSA